MLSYDVKAGAYRINPQEAIVVWHIFDLYASGKSNNYIFDHIPPTIGKRDRSFGKNSLYEILTNERYIGDELSQIITKINNGVSAILSGIALPELEDELDRFGVQVVVRSLLLPALVVTQIDIQRFIRLPFNTDGQQGKKRTEPFWWLYQL